MNDSLKNLQATVKKLWDENPLICIVAGIATANAGAKLMNANTARKNSAIHRKEIERRIRNTP